MLKPGFHIFGGRLKLSLKIKYTEFNSTCLFTMLFTVAAYRSKCLLTILFNAA